MRVRLFFAGAAMLTGSTSPASAGELFVGVLAHEVNTPFTLRSRESGVDFQLGYRGNRIEGLRKIGRPSPYVFGSLNSSGDTSFIAAGLAWTIGKKKFYLRPGIGLALHNGKIPRVIGLRRYDLGSRILFEPELGIGYRLSEKTSAEIQWTHISNATILSAQNPGLDMIGMRLNFRL